jgi:glycosyltransferase involved in cell wall biosynthesis
MKILYVTNTPISLSETFISHLVHGLSLHGHDVVLACGSGSAASIPGVAVRQLDLDSRMLQRPAVRLAMKLSLGSAWEHRRMSLRQRRASRRLAALGLSERPELVLFDYGVTAAASYRWAVEGGVPFVVLINGYDASSALSDSGYQDALLQACSSSLLTVVPSAHLGRRLELIGVPADKIEVIPYSPDYERVSRAEAVPEVAGRVASLGRLHPQKCPVALVHMMAELRRENPDAALMIVGDGPSRSEAERAIRRLALDRHVTLLGAMQHERALEVVASASVFVQHSVTTEYGDQEGFPVSLAEAAAMGKAIVSTIHSGIPENIVDGETGFLVQEHDFRGHARRVGQLLADPALRRRMGVAARARIRAICPPYGRAERLIASVERRRGRLV